MIYHYCRVSTKEQCVDRQINALNDYKKADAIFIDKQSGKDFDRPEYQKMKSTVSVGDEVIVEELDRLGRNKEEIQSELKWFSKHGVTMRMLDVPTTLMDFPGQEWIGDMLNNLLIEVLGSIAEQERKKIKKRQREGIEAMKKRGDWDRYGRPRSATDGFEKFLQKQKDGQMTVKECCAAMGISRSTYYNRVRDTVNVERK